MAEKIKNPVSRRVRRMARRRPPAPPRWIEATEIGFDPEPPHEGDDGGAAVREPRRPLPVGPSGSIALPKPTGEEQATLG